MRILVENSSNSLSNHGDAAMLIVAFNRLKELWPNASIEVITSQPKRLHAYCPEAEPIVIRYPRWWPWLRGAARRIAPVGTRRYHSMVEAEIKRRWPSKFRRILRNAISTADIVVNSGAGIITDEFEAEAIRRLILLRGAIQAGKPTAMFGQGIGPFNRSGLFALTKSVLPLVDFIGLREGRTSLPLLLDLGADPSGMAITGDDAIEIANSAWKGTPGDEIGVNVRMTAYSRFSASDIGLIASIRQALRSAETRHNALLTPIPTAPGDALSIRTVLNRQDPPPDGATEFATVFDTLERINRCRVVVTGSYHAAVFALAQGTAAVCMARSAYYSEKFLGLADQFSAGCEVVFLDDAGLAEKLEAAIDTSWRLSEDIRPRLLEAARAQIEASRNAYRRFHRLANAYTDLAAIEASN